MKILNLFIVSSLTTVVWGKVAELCPHFPEPGSSCTRVPDYAAFRSMIEESRDGDEFILCPFSITKDADEDYAMIEHGLKIQCLKENEDEQCSIQGAGEHIRIDSSSNTLIQGLEFRGSDDHAIHIVSKKEGAEMASHTICNCIFMANERYESDRGGIFMAEANAGTINVVKSTFQENYSTTYGAAIYSRTNQMNVIESRFIENQALGLGGAIFSAKDSNLLVVNSSFLRNRGKDGWPIVVNPKPGNGVWVDGYGNGSSGESCAGIYNRDELECEEFAIDPALDMMDVAELFPSIPTISPAPTPAPTTAVEGLCSTDFLQEECIDISTFAEFMTAVYNEMLGGSTKIVFCGGFRVRRSDSQRLVIPTDMNIYCQRLCTIYGRGTHMYFMGGNTQAEIHRIKFMNADESAVQVATSSTDASVTFCGCHFWGNSADNGKGGGGITIAQGSGVVNVAGCDFANNEASYGGAISHEGSRLNIVGSRFVMNQAMKTGTAIVVGSSDSHLIMQSTLIGLNRLHSMQAPPMGLMNYAVAVKPDEVGNRDIAGLFIDAGKNLITRSGDCQGFYILSDAICEDFTENDAQPIAFPYVPGDLSTVDIESGINLSTGLKIREIARSGYPVQFSSRYANRDESSLVFHPAPNGGGTFALPNGGWIYMTNSDKANFNGGSYALIFDSHGEVMGYEERLRGTSRNNNSGKSPFNSWITCEVIQGGQCVQVDPFGTRPPEKTLLGGADGGYFESVAYDDSDPDRPPIFYVTEDSSDGVLRAVRPSPLYEPGWDMLTMEAGSTFEYLVMDYNDGTFHWTPDIEEGRASAVSNYPDSEGLWFRNGILHMTSKEKNEVFSLNMETKRFTSFKPSEEILTGDGTIDGEADQLLMISDDILYFAENGGSQPGVYGRDLNARTSFAVLKAFGSAYVDDDVTGIAFSPDLTRLYVCFEQLGVMFEVRREDGLPFEE